MTRLTWIDRKTWYWARSLTTKFHVIPSNNNHLWSELSLQSRSNLKPTEMAASDFNGKQKRILHIFINLYKKNINKKISGSGTCRASVKKIRGKKCWNRRSRDGVGDDRAEFRIILIGTSTLQLSPRGLSVVSCDSARCHPLPPRFARYSANGAAIADG